MRVAVFAEIGTPAVGGGHRFQSEVASALLGATGLRHEFVGVVDSDDAASAWARHADRALDIRRTRAASALERLRRLVSDGAARRLRDGHWWHGSYPFEPFLRETLSRHGVGAILSLQPGYVPVLSIPFVTIVWDVQHRLQPIFPEVSANGEWEARESRYRMILPRASAILTGTSVGREELQRFYGVSGETVVVLPLPTPEFARRGRGPAGEPGSRPPGLARKYLFYPAQFWPHKNHVVLLRALRLLHDRGARDLRLIFVGSDKGSRGHVERVANDLGISGSVDLEGFVAQERLVELYRHAEALVFPSYFGPDNLPPLEAFAIGTPVIAARVAGTDEQLGDAALLVDAAAPGEWADAIHRVMHDAELRRSLVQKGLARSEKRTLGGYVDGLCTVFDRLEPMRDCWPL